MMGRIKTERPYTSGSETRLDEHQSQGQGHEPHLADAGVGEDDLGVRLEQAKGDGIEKGQQPNHE